MKKTEEWWCPDMFESEADYNINFTGNTRSPRFFNHSIYNQFEDEDLDNQQLSLKEDYLHNNIHDFSNQNVEYFSESDDHEQPLMAGTRKWVRQVAVQETGGYGERLLLWKRLSESDLENRISMPVIYLLDESDELLEEEDINALLRWKNHHDDLKGFQDVDVMFFEPCLNKSILPIRKCFYGTSFCLYEFTIVKKKWHEIAERNGFKKDDILQIWFFWSRNGNPCFALANLTSAEDNLPTTSDAANILPKLAKYNSSF